MLFIDVTVDETIRAVVRRRACPLLKLSTAMNITGDEDIITITVSVSITAIAIAIIISIVTTIGDAITSSTATMIGIVNTDDDVAAAVAVVAIVSIDIGTTTSMERCVRRLNIQNHIDLRIVGRREMIMTRRQRRAVTLIADRPHAIAIASMNVTVAIIIIRIQKRVRRVPVHVPRVVRTEAEVVDVDVVVEVVHRPLLQHHPPLPLHRPTTMMTILITSEHGQCARVPTSGTVERASVTYPPWFPPSLLTSRRPLSPP